MLGISLGLSLFFMSTELGHEKIVRDQIEFSFFILAQCMLI